MARPSTGKSAAWGKWGGWIHAATVLSRRIHGTLDWAQLGPEASRFRIIGSRGEAVIFWDDEAVRPALMKLRGCEENGFGSAGYGCILARDAQGRVTYAPGTIEQALERERLTWEAFGFASHVLDVVEEEAALLLIQDFIEGEAPAEKEIRAWFEADG